MRQVDIAFKRGVGGPTMEEPFGSDYTAAASQQYN
jgi:hypothetical protein